MKSPRIDFRTFYDVLSPPVTGPDCGQQCATHNLSGKPFCCDICHAVPAVYHQEWDQLRRSTDLWRVWKGDECAITPAEAQSLRAQTPRNMLLLACLGPDRCQRDYRALSCRQFPFFPYITSNDRFIGLAYEWEFEPSCWVISNLEQVTLEFRRAFVQAFDGLFDVWPSEWGPYARQSEAMRRVFVEQKRRIPILHRNWKDYLLSPASERLEQIQPARFRKFGPYQRQTG